MDSIISKLLEIASGKNARRFWGFALILLLFIFVLYPYIDANFLAYSRLNQRIDLLDKVTQLSMDRIKGEPQLMEEYNSIIAQIGDSRDKSITQASTTGQPNLQHFWIKFISGGLLLFIVAVFCLFRKEEKMLSRRKRITNAIAGFVFCIILGCLLGFIASIIPTIFSVWVNAVAFPIILLVIIALFLYSNKTVAVKNRT